MRLELSRRLVLSSRCLLATQHGLDAPSKTMVFWPIRCGCTLGWPGRRRGLQVFRCQVPVPYLVALLVVVSRLTRYLSTGLLPINSMLGNGEPWASSLS